MGGQAGARGYLAQAIITLLDAFDDEKWISFTLEPNSDQEKIDIVWYLATGSRAVQVKSSQNAITVPLIKAWAEELEHSANAEDYELRLLGPIAHGVSTFHQHGKVRIPTPNSIDPTDLIDQAAHKLDRFTESQGLASLRPVAREMIVNALVTKLTTYSTAGRAVSRETFQKIFTDWLNSITAGMNGVHRNVRPSQLPRQLPPPPADFTGRSKLLEGLSSALNGSKSRVLGLRGMGGLGKTAVALKLAADIEFEHPDGQIYFDLRGTSKTPATPEDVMLHLILSMHPNNAPPARAEDYASLSRTLLNERKLLIVLENAASIEQIEPALPGNSSTLIYTSRRQLMIPGSIDCKLPLMGMEDATALATRISPRAEAEAGRISELCGFLPLAIRIAASALQQRPDISVSSYLERLSTAIARLELVEASIGLSVELLNEESRRCFLALAVFPGTFELQAAAAIWNIDHDEASKILGQLLGFSLLNWNEEQRRYELHDLVRLYTRAHVDGRSASHASTLHSEFFLSVARAADHAYLKGGEEVLDGLSLFDSERGNIIAGFVFAAKSAESNDEAARVCSDYAANCVLCRDIRLSPIERVWWEQAAFEAASRLKDPNRMIQHLGNLARALREIGDFDQAMTFHRHILTIATHCGHDRDEVHAHLDIGLCLVAKGQLPMAINEFETCLTLARSHTDNHMEFHALSNIGVAYLESGHLKEALDPLRDALGLAISIDDPRIKAMALANMANIAIFSSEPQMALKMFDDALVIVQEMHDVKTEIKILYGIAKAYEILGNEQMAEHFRAQAKKLKNS